MNRRKFLFSTLLTSGAVLSPGLLQACKTKPEQLISGKSENFAPDVEINLYSKSNSVQLFPGEKTNVRNYKAELIKGVPDNLTNLDQTYLGPIIKVKKGEKIRVNYKNMNGEESIVHWHGLHVPEKADGHPRTVINKGETYVYEFIVKNRAGTYWFHPHPHGKTGPQVYLGLAGLFLVSDDEEASLNLPSGQFDIPLVIQDRTFDDNNQLIYLQNRMDRMMGFLGNQILINGKPNFELNLSSRAYRFRLLNGSNSRIYKLAWSNRKPLTVISTDGGLLEKPVDKDYVILGPAERIDIIANFSGMKLNENIELLSLSFPNPNRGGMMGTSGSSSLRNGEEFKLLTVKIKKEEKTSFSLPSTLSTISRANVDEAVNKNNERNFVFEMGHGMKWTINGKTFEMTSTASNEKVKLNTTEVWKFINGGSSGMGMMGNMMQIPHPVHIHQLQFRIIERKMKKNSDLWNSFKDGFIDNGWKDTFLLLPGMTVKVLLNFEDYPGLFLYHCHNLEHEDMGMMRNYLITK